MQLSDKILPLLKVGDIGMSVTPLLRAFYVSPVSLDAFKSCLVTVHLLTAAQCEVCLPQPSLKVVSCVHSYLLLDLGV